MIFNNPPKLGSVESAGKYIQTELFAWFKNLTAGLLKLDLTENFTAFRVDDLTIAAGETATLTNALRAIPVTRLIVRQTGDGLVTDGVWDINNVRLINNGAVPVTISVIFMI